MLSISRKAQAAACAFALQQGHVQDLRINGTGDGDVCPLLVEPEGGFWPHKRPIRDSTMGPGRVKTRRSNTSSQVVFHPRPVGDLLVTIRRPVRGWLPVLR